MRRSDDQVVVRLRSGDTPGVQTDLQRVRHDLDLLDVDDFHAAWGVPPAAPDGWPAP